MAYATPNADWEKFNQVGLVDIGGAGKETDADAFEGSGVWKIATPSTVCVVM